MKKALKAHESRRGRPRRAGNLTNGAKSHGETLQNGNLNGTHDERRTETNGSFLSNAEMAAKLLDGTTGKEDQPFETHDTPIPALEAMSREALPVKRRRDNYQPDKRFSSRRQSMQKQNDPKAQLVVKLCNIRKKLNWKSNKPSVDDRPRKRARVAGLDCVVHLTVWARKPGKKNNAWEQKVTRSQMCEMLRGSDDYDAVKGRFIEIKSKGCFSFRKDELMVMVEQGSTRKLTMAEDYFMEIKIVPGITDADWPPFPLLGRGANEDTELESLTREMLQDSIVAVYKKLPVAPDADTPLSICFLDDGATLESKYGLELEARWASPDEHIPVYEEPVLDDWLLDVDSNPFGSTDHTSSLQKERAKVDGDHEAAENIGMTKISEESTPTLGLDDKSYARTDPAIRQRPQTAKKSTVEPVTARKPKKPKVTYRIDLKSMREEKDNKDFQKMTVRGYKCPACHAPTWPTVEELLLHLETTHHQYTFMLETLEPADSAKGDAVIRIGNTENPKPRKGDKKQPKEEHKCWQWLSPSSPFDIRKHVIEDDKTWLGEGVKSSLRKTGTLKPHFSKHATIDPQTALRLEHGGFLPYQYVQPFRPKAYGRKRYPNVRLRTQEHVSNTPYTSISHRPVIPEDPEEGARSETDDEADDSWFIAHHLEELDLHAREENWSSAKHRLAKKWDYHVLHRERSVSSRYMSDCLVRFVRMEKKWLLQPERDLYNADEASIARMTAFIQLMDELKDKRVIDESVCANVLSLLYSGEDIPIPDEENAEIERQDAQERRAREDVQYRTDLINGTVKIGQLYGNAYNQNHNGKDKITEPLLGTSKTSLVPPDTCATCLNAIAHQNRRAVRCSAVDCPRPNTWYHARCAGLTLPVVEEADESLAKQQVMLEGAFMKERLGWKCTDCKGKEAGVAP